MARLVHAVLRALGTALVALTILAVLLLLALATPRGPAALVTAATALAGERLEVQGVAGSLLNGLSARQVAICSGRTTIILEVVDLQLRWPDLLRNRLQLTAGRTGKLTIRVTPPPPDDTSPAGAVSPLRLPVVLAAGTLEVNELILELGGEPVRLGPLGLVDGEFRNGELRFDALDAALFGFDIKATDGRFNTGEPFALSAQVAWRHDAADVSGAGPVAGDLARLQVQQTLAVPTPVSLEAELRLLVPEPGLTALATWQNLRRALDTAQQQVVTSREGSLRVAGWLDAYSAELKGVAQLGDAPAGPVQATVTGNRDELRLTRLLLEILDGSLTGTGRLSLTGTPAGRIDLSGSDLDPRYLDARFAGRLGFRAGVDFDAGGRLAVEVPEANGQLFGRPFRAQGAVARQGEDFAVSGVRVTSGENQLELDGSFGQQLAGTFRVAAPDLSGLWPTLRGRLRGEGSLGGTPAKPAFDLDLEGAGLGVGEFRVGSLRAQGGLGARGGLTVAAKAESIFLARRSLGDLSVDVEGRLEAHEVMLELVDGELELALSSTGSWQQGVLRETLGTAVLNLPGAQRWVLREPAELRLAGGELRVAAHCWDFADASLCLDDSRLHGADFSGGAVLGGLPLASLSPWVLRELTLAGTAAARVTVRREQGRLTGSLQANLRDAGISYQLPGEDPLETAFSEFRLAVSIADEALLYSFGIAETFGLQLVGAGQVLAPFSEAPTIAGRITGGMPDLRALAPLVERYGDVGDITGRVTVDATITGKALRPDIIGGLELEDGAFAVPAAGITVDRVALSIIGQQDGTAAITGRARSGKGFADMAGSVLWRNRLWPTAELTIKGRNVDVINLPEGLAQVSPNLTVALRDRQFRVSGDVLVPRAEIRLKQLSEAAVAPSPDTIVHGRSATVTEKRAPLFVLDGLRVRLGERVSFDGFGLKTGLAGNLTLRQAVAADPTAVTGDGVVTLKAGSFTAFGQRLAIERGALVFAGTVTDPALDVKAGRVVSYEGRDVSVGVVLSGTLSRIQTTVYSDPQMGELDALSYLTTGKPLSAAGAGDRNAVANAAISLGLNQALPVVQRLGSALTVDEIGLATSEAGGTAVVVGEQLGSDLYIRYSYGIFDQLGTVTATYKLSRRLSLEASSGQEQGLDLIYSISW
ncbi:MAG: translocation/assembly module TamB domain-containing protein [Gammaproteobacteria bacterium]|nr:translocation/assembly module TamB domain-containing protein [Gammaproteobacteria bacterium]